MNKSLKNKRTCKCADIEVLVPNKEVALMGWVANRRKLGSLLFITLRDISGKVQLVFDSNKNEDIFEEANQLRYEDVIEITGIVQNRIEGQENDDMITGKIEVMVDFLNVLNKSDVLPFSLGEKATTPNENLRLKYRYLDLRNANLQHNLKIRHKISTVVRNTLNSLDFTEIETPYISKSTPEGAREYLVPSRVNKGKFYSLPQSPQIYKQLLMIAGMDRYYQIARCFRDEDLRANRQPEFTQIDMEMSFIRDQNDIMEIAEQVVRNVFKEVGNFEVKLPLRRMTYADAIEFYGSDKPDLRYENKLFDAKEFLKSLDVEFIKNFEGTMKGVKFENAGNIYTRKEYDKLIQSAKVAGANLIYLYLQDGDFKGSIANKLSEEDKKKLINEYSLKENDVVLFTLGSDYEKTSVALGNVRIEFATKLGLNENKPHEILWIIDFPMFEYSEEDKRLYAKHHPFTAPKLEDIEFLESDPLRVRANSFDLVMNGQEASSGSVRIFDNELQSKIFSMLGFTDEDIKNKFGFFIEAFKYGTPPHGGLAIGLDRMTMEVLGVKDIKDVVAFPKNQSAVCLMSDSPAELTMQQLKELGLEVKKEEN